MHGAPVISCLLHGNEIAFGNPVALVVGERQWFGELIEGKSITHAPKAILLLFLCSVFCYFKNGLAEYLPATKHKALKILHFFKALFLAKILVTKHL